jgi:hypothetical protein
VISIAVALSGYFVFIEFRTDRVRDIVNNPREFEGRDVSMVGDVTEAFSLLSLGYFRIDDGTGVITVVTNRAVPITGQRVKVRGRVLEAYALRNWRGTVIVENDNAP